MQHYQRSYYLWHYQAGHYAFSRWTRYEFVVFPVHKFGNCLSLLPTKITNTDLLFLQAEWLNGSDLSGLPWNWCRCFTLFLKIDRNANHNKQNKNRQVEHTVVRVPFIFFSLSKQTQHIYTKHNWNATCQQESDEETAIHARLSLDNRRRTRKVPTPPPPPLSMFAHK